MRARRSRRIRAGVAACLVGLLAPAAVAQDEVERVDELDRWVPAVGLWSGLIIENAEARVQSRVTPRVLVGVNGNLRTPFTVEDDPTGVRPEKDGDDLVVGPFMGGGLELMTPGWSDVPGSPRLFGHLGVSYSFGGERDVAKEGDPGDPTAPGTAPGDTEFLVRNQGSRTSVEVKSPIVSAGFGVGFSIDIGDRRLRVKPSIEYQREDVEVSGVLTRAWRLDRGQIGPPVVPSSFSIVHLEGNKRRTFHNLGAGVEFEVDAARTGPFLLAVFLEAKTYRTLNERGVDFTGSAPGFTFTGDTQPISNVDDTYTVGPQEVRWSYRKDRWTYRTGIGIRFRYSPE